MGGVPKFRTFWGIPIRRTIHATKGSLWAISTYVGFRVGFRVRVYGFTGLWGEEPGLRVKGLPVWVENVIGVPIWDI